MDSTEADQVLAEMAVAGRVALDLVGRGSYPSVRPPKMRYSHEAMARLILENPAIHQNQIAVEFGRSPSWVSTIITSDAFQAVYAGLQAELLDPELRLTLQERLKALTVQSLKVLQEKLSRPASEVPDNLALRAAELGAKSLGLGQPQPSVIVASEDRLAALAHRLIALRGQPEQEIFDVESRQVA